jgi:hypothetical protein
VTHSPECILEQPEFGNGFGSARKKGHLTTSFTACILQRMQAVVAFGQEFLTEQRPQESMKEAGLLRPILGL